MKKVYLTTVREWTKRAVVAHSGHELAQQSAIPERMLGKACRTCETEFYIAIDAFKATGDLPALRFLQDELAPPEPADADAAKKKEKRKSPKPDFIAEGHPVVTFVNEGVAVELGNGESVRDAAAKHGVSVYKNPLAKLVGERSDSCTSCRVQVSPASAVNPPTELEKKAGLPAGVRLACQLHPTADITVTI